MGSTPQNRISRAAEVTEEAWDADPGRFEDEREMGWGWRISVSIVVNENFLELRSCQRVNSGV